MTGRIRLAYIVALTIHLSAAGVWAERPIPNGPATVTLRYDTAIETLEYSAQRGFQDNAIGPGNATILDGAPNITAFNSVNSFGRRTALASNLPFAHVIGENESLITNAFFKNVPNGQVGDEFFPGLVQDGNITISIQDITFDGPVHLDPSTLMLHVLFFPDQFDQVHPLGHHHNHHTQTDPFRDIDDFLLGGIFSTDPLDHLLADINPTISGNGTNTLGVSLTFPYSILQSLEGPAAVPGGLPAPQGFLEPFHFHLEYVVTPEPASAMLVALGGALAFSRRSRRTYGRRDIRRAGI